MNVWSGCDKNICGMRQTDAGERCAQAPLVATLAFVQQQGNALGRRLAVGRVVEIQFVATCIEVDFVLAITGSFLPTSEKVL
jgi:hypothetical protein